MSCYLSQGALELLIYLNLGDGIAVQQRGSTTCGRLVLWHAQHTCPC